MKRSAKNINITNPLVVLPWVTDCIGRHYRRRDFRNLLIEHGLKKSEYYRIKRENDKASLAPYCLNIANTACSQIRSKNLSLSKITIRERRDPSNGKIRPIGNEGALQQVLDYIAVYSSMDIFRRRIVLAQVSSIKGRGQMLGIRLIRSWLKKDNSAAKYAKKHNLRYSRRITYFVKLDIRKCFPSARLEIFLEYFRRDCGNQDILWLWEQLLRSHRTDDNQGFMIGALPSCWALQYMVSYVYRKAMDMHYVRRGQAHKTFYKCAIFMDDILLLGSNCKQMRKGIKELISYTKEAFGLELKPSWHIEKLTSPEDMQSAKAAGDSRVWHEYRLKEKAIDMMGYIIHPDGSCTIRGRTFIKARRVILRFNRTGAYNLKQAERACSYKGYFKHSANYRLEKLYNIGRAFAEAAKVVSMNARLKAGGKKHAKSIL